MLVREFGWGTTPALFCSVFSESGGREGGREGGEGMEYSMLRIDAPLAISVQQQTQGKTSVQY